MLPRTSPNHYLTGMTAMNIPTEEGGYGDWHFHEAFFGRNNLKPTMFLAGKDKSWDTYFIFGDYGVYNCAHILQKYGLEISGNENVYAADHFRAFLDLLYHSIKTNQFPHHLSVESWFDSIREKNIIFEKIMEMKKYLSSEEWQMIQSWIKTQR
jgi:hypothetical protein